MCTGLPFYRIEKLQQGFRIPLPSSTQWGLVEDGAKSLNLMFQELINRAAQGDVLYNDDTTMKILKMTKEQRAAAAADNADESRTGTFTSGIISTKDQRKDSFVLHWREACWRESVRCTSEALCSVAVACSNERCADQEVKCRGL
jgi:hypothetical protein